MIGWIQVRTVGRADLARVTNEVRRLFAWAYMKQRVIDVTIDQWRRRLQACVRAEGRHFEHLL